MLLLIGCTDEGDDFMDQRQAQDAELAQRPSLEQEQARLTAARNAIRERLSAELDLTAWSERDNGDAAGCADFEESSGVTAFLPTLLLTGGVPDAQWPAAAELVEQVAGEHGFGSADVVVVAAGEHEIVLRGESGSMLRFGTLGNATLALETGCHLPEASR